MPSIISAPRRSLASLPILPKAPKTRLQRFRIAHKCAAVRVTDCHSESRLERCDVRHAVIWRDVVDGLSAGSTFEEKVCFLGDALEGSVAGFEVDYGGPVV
jgi:hypothetical protein